MNPCIHEHEAIEKLLSYSSPEKYEAILTEFWEAWLTNEIADGMNADQRSEMLCHYKYLRNFLLSVNLATGSGLSRS